VLRKVSGRRNSGGASPPRATATGGAPPQAKIGDRVDLVRLLSFFPSSPAVKITVTCNQKKTHKQSILVNFF
jgi:hypothetical protein